MAAAYHGKPSRMIQSPHTYCSDFRVYQELIVSMGFCRSRCPVLRRLLTSVRLGDLFGGLDAKEQEIGEGVGDNDAVDVEDGVCVGGLREPDDDVF